MLLPPCFCDLPHGRRLALRAAIAAAGGHVAGYCGPYVQVAIPNPSGPFFLAMEAAGLELDEHSLCYFPLGTDAPPAAAVGPLTTSPRPGRAGGSG
jgi:hypothetical protein